MIEPLYSKEYKEEERRGEERRERGNPAVESQIDISNDICSYLNTMTMWA